MQSDLLDPVIAPVLGGSAHLLDLEEEPMLSSRMVYRLTVPGAIEHLQAFLVLPC